MTGTDRPIAGIALDLAAHRNSTACWEPGAAVPEGFDGHGRTYPARSLEQRTRELRLPPGFGRGEPDNVACEGQILSIDDDSVAGSAVSAVHVVTGVHVVGAGTQGIVRETFRLRGDSAEQADGRRVDVSVPLGDFLTRGPVPGAEHYHEADFLYDIGGRPEPSVRPRLWQATVLLPRPVPCTRLELPFNPDLHVFGVWLTTSSATTGIKSTTPAADDQEYRP